MSQHWVGGGRVVPWVRVAWATKVVPHQPGYTAKDCHKQTEEEEEGGEEEEEEEWSQAKQKQVLSHLKRTNSLKFKKSQSKGAPGVVDYLVRPFGGWFVSKGGWYLGDIDGHYFKLDSTLQH